MNSLAKKKCGPCQGDGPTVTGEKMAELKPQVLEWNVLETEPTLFDSLYRFQGSSAILSLDYLLI